MQAYLQEDYDLGTHQRHKKVVQLGRILNVFRLAIKWITHIFHPNSIKNIHPLPTTLLIIDFSNFTASHKHTLVCWRIYCQLNDAEWIFSLQGGRGRRHPRFAGTDSGVHRWPTVLCATGTHFAWIEAERRPMWQMEIQASHLAKCKPDKTLTNPLPYF